MQTATVRLNALADITHRSREAIRNIQKFGDAPWDDDAFPKDQHRRYTAFHALALVVSEVLMAQGCSVALAGEFMRYHESALNRFLDEVEGAHPITPRFVMVLQTAIEDNLAGLSWQQHVYTGTGTAEELKDGFRRALESVGAVETSRDGRIVTRTVGGPSTSVASIPEAYRLLRLRAKAAGYVVDGRAIFKVAEDAAEGEE